MTLRKRLSRAAKPFERAGRFLLQHLMALVLGVKKRALVLPPVPRILVVRLDRRVGNLILLTPFLSSLRATLPAARITLLCHKDMAHVLRHHPAVNAQEHYVKWRLFSREGVFAMLARLRREKFDLAFDAGSFFGAAVTHPMIVRFCGAKFLVGPKRAPLSRIYHASVPMLAENAPDKEQRLQLLRAVPQPVFRHELLYAEPRVLESLAREHAEFLQLAAPSLGKTLVIVTGGRTRERQLPKEMWAEAAKRALGKGFAVTLLWGSPGERAQAEFIAKVATAARVAPSSNLDEAAVLFAGAAGVAGNDTGTSHIAAAVGAKLFVAFLVTDPARYAHKGSTAVDLRAGLDAFLPAFDAWLLTL